MATQALKKIHNSNRELDNENARLERDVESLRESNKQMELVRNRLDSEIVYTETTIGRVQDNIAVLSERFEGLQESLKASVTEEKSLAFAVTKIENEITALNNKGELLIRERHVLEAKISSMRHEQASMSKVAQTLAREEKAVLSKIHDTELERATIQNEMARLELDQLNVTQHNISLQQKRKEELAALSDVESKIDAQETAISRCNDEIEKKTAKIAKLNRQYNNMVEGYEGEEPVGPLEATVKSLARDIEKESAEIRGLQKEWLLRQTELIKVSPSTLRRSQNLTRIFFSPFSPQDDQRDERPPGKGRGVFLEAQSPSAEVASARPGNPHERNVTQVHPSQDEGPAHGHDPPEQPSPAKHKEEIRDNKQNGT